MNKTLLGVLVTGLAVLAIGGVFILNNKDDSSNQPTAGTMSQDSMRDGSMAMPDSSSMPESDSDAVVETNKVSIQDFDYAPATIRVKKGTTVTWTNQDSAKHNVAFDNPTDEYKDGPLIGQGETYEFTFNTVGTFSYYCSPHPYMKASVEVVE